MEFAKVSERKLEAQHSISPCSSSNNGLSTLPQLATNQKTYGQIHEQVQGFVVRENGRAIGWSLRSRKDIRRIHCWALSQVWRCNSTEAASQNGFTSLTAKLI